MHAARCGCGEWAVVLNKTVKESLTVKMTLARDLKKVRRLDMAAIWGKSVLGRRDSKSHKAGVCLECSRNSREAHKGGVG